MRTACAKGCTSARASTFCQEAVACAAACPHTHCPAAEKHAAVAQAPQSPRWTVRSGALAGSRGGAARLCEEAAVDGRVERPARARSGGGVSARPAARIFMRGSRGADPLPSCCRLSTEARFLLSQSACGVPRSSGAVLPRAPAPAPPGTVRSSSAPRQRSLRARRSTPIRWHLLYQNASRHKKTGPACRQWVS